MTPTFEFVTALRWVCTATSIFFNFSSIPDIIVASWRNKKPAQDITQGTVQLVDNVVGLAFAYLINDNLSFRIRLMGLAINVAGLATLYYYSGSVQETRYNQKRLVQAMVSIAAVFATASFLPTGKADLLGLINTATAISFAATPLMDTKRMLAMRDVSNISPTMTTALALSACSWGLYGVYLRNVWMIVPNFITAALSFVQLAMLVALRGGPATSAKAPSPVRGSTSTGGGVGSSTKAPVAPSSLAGASGYKQPTRSPPASAAAAAVAAAGLLGSKEE